MKAQKRVSAITLRILAINMTALVLLAIGLLYVVQYQDRLIAAELDSMKAEAVLFSGAIAEGATQNRLSRIIQPFQSSVNRVIMPNMARRMVRRFSEAKKVHVQVFDSVGGLIADSDDFKNAPGRVHADDLPAPDEENAFSKFVSGMIDGLLNIIPKRITLQDPPDVDGLSAGAYPDAKDGLNGRLSARVWMHPEEKVIYMSAAAPIQRVRQIVGVAYLSKPATNIEAQIREMQVEILKIFIIIFALTIVFSFYLASTMASPISKLARAAYRIRGSKNRDIAIPDLSHRKDEIGELSIALRDMTNSLWQRMDAIERFAADVAHEIKNP
ncbi:MAG TPA: histidine kinase, partial [Rhodospirillaceae bacterium]|nr:histidine kinase [Rhodospirillaceae bacterium]